MTRRGTSDTTRRSTGIPAMTWRRAAPLRAASDRAGVGCAVASLQSQVAVVAQRRSGGVSFDRAAAMNLGHLAQLVGPSRRPGSAWHLGPDEHQAGDGHRSAALSASNAPVP